MPTWVDRDDWSALQKAFDAGQLVIFVGAGISAAGGLPLWPKLAELLIERVRRAGAPAAAEEAQQSLQRGRLVEAISAAQHALGPTVFGDAVARALDDRGKDVPEVARAIAALRGKLHGAVTTNLDRFLERATGGEWLETVKPVGDLVQQRGFLWKAHGTIQDRATWVFARSGYERVMFGDAQYRATFGALYRACTLLFVGCSLSDDDLDITLAEVRALSGDQPPMHFAVLQGPIGEYRRRTLEQAGIRIVSYASGRHDLVTGLLEELGGPSARTTNGRSSAVTPGPTAASATGIHAGDGRSGRGDQSGLLAIAMLRKLHGAVLSASLDRDALLTSIDKNFVAGLRRAPAPSAQVWEDLVALNAVDALVDGSVPLRVWLETAELLAGPRRESGTFRAALSALGAS